MTLIPRELVRHFPPPVAEVAALSELRRVPVADLEERHLLFCREAFAVSSGRVYLVRSSGRVAHGCRGGVGMLSGTGGR